MSAAACAAKETRRGVSLRSSRRTYAIRILRKERAHCQPQCAQCPCRETYRWSAQRVRATVSCASNGGVLMQLASSDILENLKKQGLRLTAISVVSTICLGIIDQFTSKIIPTAVQKIEHLIDPPKFFINFGGPVDLSAGLVISALTAEGAVGVKYNTIDSRVVAALAGPGAYTVRLRRMHDQVAQELVSTKAVEKSNEIWQIDVSERNWVNASELRGTKGSASIALTETRWSATEPDFAVAATVKDPVMRSMIANALAEVGVYENGSEREKSRILSYWQGFPGFENLTSLPWAGAFIGWVVKQAGAEPAAGAPRAVAWRSWGAPADVTPGTVAVFAPTNTASTGVVGIVLRRQSKCIEAVIGNVVDRVVISCVAASRLTDVRRPSSALPESTPDASASKPRGE